LSEFYGYYQALALRGLVSEALAQKPELIGLRVIYRAGAGRPALRAWLPVLKDDSLRTMRINGRLSINKSGDMLKVLQKTLAVKMT
jgi:hypothetical protein